MDKLIAFCGLNCATCPAFGENKENNNQKRSEVAEAWSTSEIPLKPDDINCDGCLTKNGRVIYFIKGCVIRNCGLEKKG